MTCICHLLIKENDLAPILAGAVACYAVNFIMYSIVFSKAFVRAICVDKGVKTFEGIKMRYGMGLCSLTSAASAGIKAGGTLAIVNLLGKQGDSLCMYLQAAGVVLLILLASFHNQFWAQRPFPLLFINGVAEGFGLLAAAYTMCMAE
eukprot:CAMPEP_0174860602 /NCGR_PEP_ID=MMETSP1114-20130205/49591_1 /TAXON_ID=312471 /ORGANISM="Neobodo designis, Strain CCAP 1951/1" /LENGTH=147 /DNA_ID=CAMNT_0016095585 /DNA_START=53 /DNA_END=494 /DNA_ORIENTATION=+